MTIFLMRKGNMYLNILVRTSWEHSREEMSCGLCEARKLSGELEGQALAPMISYYYIY